MSHFPPDFLWGVASAGHQNEGNDHVSDISFLEQLTPTIFREPSGEACRSYELWEDDLDLAVSMGLNAYRFSVEWARIEPDEGAVCSEALDHYEAVVEGCLERGLAPIVTLCHFSTPLWFAARGSWLAEGACAAFSAHCRRVMERFGDRVAMVITLNEPNLEQMLMHVLPEEVQAHKREMLESASRSLGVDRFRASNVVLPEEVDQFQAAFTRAHLAAKSAVKAVRPDIPVGVSIAVTDEYAVAGGEHSRDAKRAAVYDHWLEVAADDDFLGVQNYERIVHGPDGIIAPREGVDLNGMGTEIEPASLAGAVRYAHEASGVPILVSEHGIQTADDGQREAFIPAALDLLEHELAAGVPVLGYCHWTLMDNFEWISGYGAQLGLHGVDPETFARVPKPSAAAYGRAVRRHRAVETADAAAVIR